MRKRISLNQNWNGHKDNKGIQISVPFVLDESIPSLSRKASSFNLQEGKSYFLEIKGYGSEHVFLSDKEVSPISGFVYPLTGLSQSECLEIRTDDTLIIHSIALIETDPKSVFFSSISTDIKGDEFIIQSEIRTDSDKNVRFSLINGKEKTEGEYTTELHLQGLHPWTIDDPFLYEFAVSVYDENDQLMDSDTRVIGFYENKGNPLFGMNYKAYLRTKGYALSKDDIENDIRSIKESGFKFIKCVFDDTILSFCDKYGLLAVTDSPSYHPCSFCLPTASETYTITDYLKHRRFHKKDIVSITQGSDDLEELFRFFSMQDPNLSFALLGNYEDLIGSDRKNKTDSCRMIEAFLSKKKFTYILNKDRKTKISKKMTIDVLSNEEELTLYVNNMKLATLKEKILFSFTIPYFRTCNAVVKGKDSKDKATFLTETK